MAKIYTDPKDLPPQNGSEEADECVAYIRELRGKPKQTPKNAR